MLFMIRGHDADRGPVIRQQEKDSHLRWVEQRLGAIRLAGPLLDDSGRMVGSLFLIEAEDRAEAERLIGEDPYYRAGLWREIEIEPFMAAAGTWIGGTCW